MNLALRPLTAATLSVRLGASRFGNPEPQIEVRFPRQTHHRQLGTALHLLAAAVEMATPRSERWCVQTEGHDTTGRVFLELCDATEAEAQRGLAVLVAVREQALAS
jgi:Ser-tRNA(Ala) deacylase AlaX